jgi:hypothetical protein
MSEKNNSKPIQTNQPDVNSSSAQTEQTRTAQPSIDHEKVSETKSNSEVKTSDTTGKSKRNLLISAVAAGILLFIILVILAVFAISHHKKTDHVVPVRPARAKHILSQGLRSREIIIPKRNVKTGPQAIVSVKDIVLKTGQTVLVQTASDQSGVKTANSVTLLSTATNSQNLLTNFSPTQNTLSQRSFIGVISQINGDTISISGQNNTQETFSVNNQTQYFQAVVR